MDVTISSLIFEKFVHKSYTDYFHGAFLELKGPNYFPSLE